jgi:hypothetical protein
MALDFSILTQAPTFGERFAAGRQAAQEEAQRNMLLQQRQMEFQQSQEDRRRKLEQESKFDRMADLIRENGLDPDDPKVLGQFAQAAMAARQPQLVSFVTSMAERAAKRRQALAEAEAVRGAMREPGEEPVAPAGVVSAPPVVAPAMAAAPELSQLAVDQAAYARPRGFAQGQFVGGAPTAVAMPVGEYPTEPAPVNALAPQPVAPANAMVAPAAQAAVPAAPAAPAARAAAPDVARMEDELEQLQTRYDRVAALGTEAARKQAALLKPEIDRLSRRIERASKAGAADPAELRTMDALGIPRTEAGFARFNELKQRPEAMSTLSRLIAERDRLAPTDPNRKLYDDAIKKATTQAEGTTVKVELPPQEKAERGERGKLLVKQYETVSDAARLATRTLPTLETQERILDAGFRTGFGAEAQKAGASLLSALGMPEAKEYATNAQAFSAAMNQAVLQKQLEQKGVQTQADADRITQTGAQLTNTVDANRFIIAVARAQLKRDIAQRNFYDKWWKENKTYDGAEDAWATGEGNKSLFESPELKRFAAPVRQPAAATPGAAVAPAGAGPYSDPDKERRYQEWKRKQGAR